MILLIWRWPSLSPLLLSFYFYGSFLFAKFFSLVSLSPNISLTTVMHLFSISPQFFFSSSKSLIFFFFQADHFGRETSCWLLLIRTTNPFKFQTPIFIILKLVPSILETYISKALEVWSMYFLYYDLAPSWNFVSFLQVLYSNYKFSDFKGT